MLFNAGLMQHMERCAVSINARHGFTAVNIADEPLRRCDPFEHAVRGGRRWSSAMTTDGQYSFFTVRVADPQDKKPGARVFSVADLINGPHCRPGPGNLIIRDESRNTIIAVVTGSLPGPTAAYGLRLTFARIG